MRLHLAIFLVASFPLGSVCLLSCSNKTTVSSIPATQAPYDLVAPLIGTSGDHGQQFPGATRPFGMVKLSPDTYPGGLNRSAHTGYDYEDSRIMGFSHLRVGGMGAKGVGGNILVLPRVGSRQIVPEKYSLPFRKKTEEAAPGYYSVELSPGIRIKLTGAQKTGFHRYQFRKGDDAHVLIDLGRGFTAVRDARILVRGNDEVSGFVTCDHSFNKSVTYTVYFNAIFSKPFDHWELWNINNVSRDKGEEKGAQIGGIFNYPSAPDEAIMMKVGLSTIDEDDARNNREKEIPHWDFDAVRTQARREWESYLNRIVVEGGTLEQQRMFYTSLYRCLSEPMDVTSLDGRFRGHDLEIYRAEEWRYFDCFSLWDTFRTKDPLLTLLVPEITSDIIRSLVFDLRHESTGTYPFLMVRMDQIVPVIVDAYRKGIPVGEVEAVYEKLKTTTGSEEERRDYATYGYIPGRPDRTLELAYDDWCLAQMANELDNDSEYESFAERSKGYRNIWNPETRFSQGRQSDGSWMTLGDPTDFNKALYEGTPWQWRWFVPHDVAGLTELVGGKTIFGDELEKFFADSLYTHGNQIDLHCAYLFNFCDRPWVTQQIVRQILTEPVAHLYGTHKRYERKLLRRTYEASPQGFIPEMDDDLGTMSAWYVWSALGIYPLCPGDPKYTLGYPLFDKASIHLANDKTLTIEKKGNPRVGDAFYRATFNDRALDDFQIDHKGLSDGGVLRFEAASRQILSSGHSAE